MRGVHHYVKQQVTLYPGTNMVQNAIVAMQLLMAAHPQPPLNAV